MDKISKQLENYQDNELENYFMENFFNDGVFDIQLFYDFLDKETNKKTKKKYVKYFLYEFFPYLFLSFPERLDILTDLKKYATELVTKYELDYLLTFFEKITLLEFDKVYKDDEENKSNILSLLEDYKNKSTGNEKEYLQAIIYFLEGNYDKYDKIMFNLIEKNFLSGVEDYVDYLLYNLKENKTADTIDNVERKLNLISEKLKTKEPLAVFYEIIGDKEKSIKYYKKAAENIDLNALLYLVKNKVLQQVEIQEYIQKAKQEEKRFNNLENMIFDFIKGVYYINYEYDNKKGEQFLLLAFEQAKILQNKEIILESAKLLFEIIDDKKNISEIIQVVSYYDMNLAEELGVKNFEKEKNYMGIIGNYMFAYINNFDDKKVIGYFKKHLYAILDGLVKKNVITYNDINENIINLLKEQKDSKNYKLIEKALNLFEIVNLLEKNKEDKNLDFLFNIYEKIYLVFKEDDIKFVENILLNLLLDLPYSKIVLYYMIKDNFKKGVSKDFYKNVEKKYIQLNENIKFEKTNDLEKFLLKVFDEIFDMNVSEKQNKNIIKFFEIIASYYSDYSEKDTYLQIEDLLINIKPDNSFFIFDGKVYSTEQIEQKIPPILYHNFI